MKLLRRLARIELVLIYLVIIAGSVVRMTGSGMGCPDWPKCFGYLIPPTERAQIEWQADYPYAKGQIIIVDESLQVAKSNFTSAQSFTPSNWAPYTKHDYAIFNAFHTWTEYINRLIGALAGIPMLLLVVLSLIKIKRKPIAFVLSLAGLFMLGFEAWLGKLVVDGNLIPGSITIHMLGALIIVAILLMLLRVLREERDLADSPAKFKGLLWIALVVGVAQIIWGTQVREQVDHLNEAGVLRANWMDRLDWHFYVHRSFSILVTLVHVGLFYLGWKNPKLKKSLKAIVGVIFAEIVLGIVLSYFDFPKWAQPAHLLLATIMFGLHVYLLSLTTFRSKKASFS